MDLSVRFSLFGYEPPAITSFYVDGAANPSISPFGRENRS